jgi:nitroreductase
VLPWLLGGAAAIGAGAAALAWRRDAGRYAHLAAATWRGPVAAPPLPLELVRCATLAPNSHNTQPWRFAMAEDAVRILPDAARRTPAVDPDDHHLHASLGCAVETMLQAAPALGLSAVAEDLPGGGALLRLASAAVAPTALSAAIARRASTRAAFDPTPPPPSDLAALDADGGADPRVGMVLVTAPAARAALADLILTGNAVQVRDAAFVAELKSWIRFDHRAATARRDGLFAGAMGNPMVPEVFGRFIFDRVFTEAREADRQAALLRATAGYAIFAAERPDAAHWLAAGRAAQRFCLRATVLGLRTAWVNQPVEVAALRPALAGLAGLGDRRPDLVLRFGRGPALPRSLRRPLGEVLMDRTA